VALPIHMRNHVGVCLAICIQAVEWRMSPFAVANKSYVVNDRVAYESQLIHAVIEQRAPLAKRLRHTFAGEGSNRTCTIIGHVRGEDQPFEYMSPPTGQITPKNSPLWKSKPDLQLFYNASRDWARMYFPDVIMGVYSDDEIAEAHGTFVASKPRTLAEVAAIAHQPTFVEEPADHAEPEPKPAADLPQTLRADADANLDAWNQFESDLSHCETRESSSRLRADTLKDSRWNAEERGFIERATNEHNAKLECGK